VEALVAGQPTLKNLQKITLFSSQSSIPLVPGGAEDATVAVWEEGRLFDRIFDGLMAFLDPKKVRTCLFAPFTDQYSLSTFWSRQWFSCGK
jgi:CLIP-associating protein 1/2